MLTRLEIHVGLEIRTALEVLTHIRNDHLATPESDFVTDIIICDIYFMFIV